MRMLVLAEYTKETKGADNKTRTRHNFQFVELNDKNKPMGKAIFVSQDKAPEKVGLQLEAPYTCELFLGPMRTVFQNYRPGIHVPKHFPNQGLKSGYSVG